MKHGFVDGWNPIRWNCKEQGCWNEKCRAPIHFFSCAIPRKMGMSDIDMTAEVGGHFLFGEFKSGEPSALPVGQRIYAERLTGRPKSFTYIVVWHEPGDTMAITHITIVKDGVARETRECSAIELRDLIAGWSSRSDYKEAAE